MKMNENVRQLANQNVILRSKAESGKICWIPAVQQKGWVRMGSYGKPLTDHIQSDWDISLSSLNNSCKIKQIKTICFFV